MDIYAVLTQDHRQAMDLVVRLADNALDRAARTALLVELQSLMMAHHHVEETLIYDALAQLDEGRTVAAEAVRQHEQCEELLASLSGARDGLAWTEKLDSFRKALGRQFAAEEHAIFAIARRRLDGQQLAQTVAGLRAEYAGAAT
jgi:hypothetical protein